MLRYSPKQIVLALILFSGAIRLLLAGTIGLGVDESYVVSMARSLSLSYFDHPPLHFWLIWLTTHITGSELPIVLRLPFILLFAGTTWLMFRLGALLFGEWAGAYAAITLNLSAVFSLSTGGWVLPDGPLMFFLMAGVFTLAQLIFFPDHPTNWLYWVLAGMFIGLGFLAKYHAVFILLGGFVFLVTCRTYRPLLFTAGPYLTFLTASLFSLPVFCWNMEYSWVSFVFQSSRGVAKGLYPGKLLANILGQAAWVLPWIWLPLVGSLVAIFPRKFADIDADCLQQRRWFLICLALGPILLFTTATLWGSQGLFHWEAPGYLFLFPLLGEAIVRKMTQSPKTIERWLLGSAALFLVLLGILAAQTATGWLEPLFPQTFAKGDPTLEAYDWRGIAPKLAEAGLLAPPVQFVVTGHWIDAGKIDYALGGKLPVLCLNNEPHHFAFRHQMSAFKGQDALIIGRKEAIHDAANMLPYFDSITFLGTMPVERSGRVEFLLYLFSGHNFHGDYPLPYGR